MPLKEAEILICQICEESEAEGWCHDCKEPVCFECCIGHTYMNQIDYELCVPCMDTRESESYEEACVEYEREKKAREKKEKRNAIRKANYWKPENVEKRRMAKAKKKWEKAERFKKMLEETFKIVNSMF